MTVSSITPVNNYSGDGSNKTFDFDFPIEDKDELVVTKIQNDGTEIVLTCDLDYEIAIVTDNDNNFVSYGQNITFPIASSTHGILDDDEKISLALSLSIEQQKEMGNSNKLNLSTLEWCLDYLTRIAQILNRKLERAVKVQEGSDIDTDVLVTNLKKVADNSSNIETVVNNLTTITAVKNNAANINTVAADKTNIDAVANDLTNIDNASAYADNAKDWAIKMDGTVDGSEYSAKYYASQASQGQVQADWTQTDNTKKDYIKNKPTKLSDFTDDLGQNPAHTHSQYLTSHQDVSDKLNKTQITDCILEAPNGVLTYSGSTLTAHQGLKVLIPDGRNADGTLKNIEYTLSSDITFTYNFGANIPYDEIFINSETNKIARLQSEHIYNVKTYSDLSSTGSNQYRIAYVQDNNKYYQTSDTGTTWTEKQFAKLGNASINSSNTITSLTSYNPIRIMTQDNYKGVVETYINGTSWYRVYSDGWCEQGGLYDAGSNIAQTKDIYLLKSYKDTNYNPLITVYRLSGLPAQSNQLEILSVATNKFTVGMEASTWRFVYWQTTGYIR